VDTSLTSATYQGLWAHLQQPLATTAGIYNSYASRKLRNGNVRKGKQALHYWAIVIIIKA
jgi:hypothetical protein